MLLTIVYQLMVLALVALFVWNLFAAKEMGKRISCCLVLVPLLLRLFLIR